ncbi:uncharacterized protein LOC131939392 [Physella acuta]|uniref:uncharacterized protein LOC131939392 n=1 Tax=Physella acuta TaxID=109671 RepID=UPI0027DD62F3|nr:uncharacterized protein LOC131939392 [Physella acuta]
MWMGITACIVLLCICCHAGCISSSITLNAPDTSTCAGVIQVNAKVKFTAVVDFSSWHDSWSKSVLFEFKPTSAATFTHLCVVNLNNTTCSYTSQLMCYCSHNTNKIYHIVINATLYEKNSRAEIRGYVKYTEGQQWYSEVQRYPPFYNISALNFTINGRSLQPDSKVFELKTNESTITFCCRDLPSPCRANIKHQQVVASGEPCAVYNISSTHQQGSFNLTLASEFCKRTKEMNVWFSYENNDEGLTENNVLIVSLVTALIVLIIVIQASLFYFKALQKSKENSMSVNGVSLKTVSENVNADAKDDGFSEEDSYSDGFYSSVDSVGKY